MHFVASDVLRSNYIKPWFHFPLLDSSAGRELCVGYTCMVADAVCMYVVITRKAQVVQIVLTVSMGNTIKRMKCFRYRKKYF